MSTEYRIFPIGWVSKTEDRTTIEILPEFQDGLTGLEGFSHVIVLYWFLENDSPDKRATLKVHPRRNPSNPLTGVFGTRSPSRPNLIGMSVCRIIAIEQGNLLVQDLDARDGTPVIDIKPYIDRSDCVPDSRAPDWVSKDAQPQGSRHTKHRD